MVILWDIDIYLDRSINRYIDKYIMKPWRYETAVMVKSVNPDIPTGRKMCFKADVNEFYWPTVSVLREDDIEVLTEDGGKGGGETSPNRPLSRTPRWDQNQHLVQVLILQKKHLKHGGQLQIITCIRIIQKITRLASKYDAGPSQSIKHGTSCHS